MKDTAFGLYSFLTLVKGRKLSCPIQSSQRTASKQTEKGARTRLLSAAILLSCTTWYKLLSCSLLHSIAIWFTEGIIKNLLIWVKYKKFQNLVPRDRVQVDRKIHINIGLLVMCNIELNKFNQVVYIG